jgi:hypothetical protein
MYYAVTTPAEYQGKRCRSKRFVNWLKEKKLTTAAGTQCLQFHEMYYSYNRDVLKRARTHFKFCSLVKNTIVYCLEGEFISDLETGEKIKLSKGGTYVVSDELSSHRSVSANGVKLLIIDGDFLKNNQ